MAGRLLVFLTVAALAGPAEAQAPVQLYPRAAPAAPTPDPSPDAAPGLEPARPVTPPEPLPPIAAPRGIAVTPLPPAVQPPAAQPPVLPSPPPSSSAGDEVLDVVEGFYAALGRGDGQGANAFLVPEKRNQGAYDIAAMTRFYSAMREPLRVLGLGRLDPEIVRVQYAYTHQSGRRCDGVADVTVHRVGGRALIERIRALSGC